MTIKKLLVFIIFGLFISFLQADEFKTEVITLHNQTADEVLPTIQSLLPSGATATSFQGQLIVKTTAQNLQEIKTVLEQIDMPAKELMISVKQDSNGSESTSGYAVNGQLNTGPHVTITHNGDGTITQSTENHATVNIINSRSSFNDNDSQQIRAIEGRPAYISIGQQVPVVNSVRQYPYGTTHQSTEYKDVLQGFYVTAHLNGNNHVMLDLSTQNDHIGGNQSINVQQANTSVSGPLGQWIAVGGTTNNNPNTQTGIVFSTNNARQQSNTIYIKVDQVSN
jgi:type II secretory pathway component HofQ